MGVLLAAGSCESSSKPDSSMTVPGPAASRPVQKAPSASTLDEPLTEEGWAHSLAYQDGALFWAHSPRVHAISESIHRYDLTSKTQTSVYSGEFRSFVLARGALVLADKSRLLLISLVGDAPRILAENQDLPWSLHSDGTHVYWHIANTQHVRIGPNHPASVRRVSLEGGAVEELATDAGGTRMTLHGGDLYWADDKGIHAIRATGGDVRLVRPRKKPPSPGEVGVASSPAMTVLAVVEDNLYFSEKGSAYRHSMATSETQLLYDAKNTDTLLPIDESRMLVYTNDSELGDPRYRADEATREILLVDDGKTTALATREGLGSLTVGEGVVYYIDSPEDSKQARRLRSVALPSFR